ncbi:MAG: YtxH domain-containing protein [Aggregatilineales bacterium]
MRRMMFFVIGILCGVTVGGVAALLLSPASGDAMRHEARERFDELMREAQKAAEARRVELETQLADLTRP